MRTYIPKKLREKRASLDKCERVFQNSLDNPENLSPTQLEAARRGLRRIAKDRAVLDKEIETYTSSRRRVPETSSRSASVLNPRAINCDIERLDDVNLSVALHFASLLCNLNRVGESQSKETAAWDARLEELQVVAAARWGSDWEIYFRRLYDMYGSRQ